MSKRRQHPPSWSDDAGDDPLRQAAGVALDALRDAAVFRGITPKLGLIALVDSDDQLVVCVPHFQEHADNVSLLLNALELYGARVAIIPRNQG